MVSEVLDISQTIPDYKSLNPCSCGGWSQSAIANARESGEYSVLILVLVEDGLRDS